MARTHKTTCLVAFQCWNGKPSELQNGEGQFGDPVVDLTRRTILNCLSPVIVLRPKNSFLKDSYSSLLYGDRHT